MTMYTSRMDWSTINALVRDAEAHERGEPFGYAAGRDLYIVAADAAEAGGYPSYADGLRVHARRLHVASWAFKRWPGEGIRLEHVIKPPRFDDFTYRVYRPSMGGWNDVRVGKRKGRVTIMGGLR